MNLSVSIPDDLAQRLGQAGEDLSRRALEAFAVEEFRAGRLSQPELRQFLGFATRGALDGFLKARGDARRPTSTRIDATSPALASEAVCGSSPIASAAGRS